MNNGNLQLSLLYTIVDYELGSKVLKFGKKLGITGGTIFYGTGTTKNTFLQFLGLNEAKKEIVLMATFKEVADKVIEELNNKFQFYKPNKGIAFTITINKILGAHNLECKSIESRGVENSMYDLIFTIVDRGKGESVVDAANKVGSKGATIINARGSGIHETSKFFAMEIEPEKEVVLIVSPKELTENITKSIKTELKIDQPGNGIIFIQSIDKAYGLRD